MSPDGPRAGKARTTGSAAGSTAASGGRSLEDEYDLLDDREAPAVVELPPQPERQLAELVRLTEVA